MRLSALQASIMALALLAGAAVAVASGFGTWAAGAAAVAAVAAALRNERRLRRLRRELNAAQRTRAEAERRYLRLYSHAVLGVFRADVSGRLTAANPSLVALLGYRSEPDLLAQNFAEQVYVGPGRFEYTLRRAREQGALEKLEMRLRRFDGQTVTVVAALHALWDEAGEVTVFECTLVDVTQERFADGQRRSMERRFRRLFDATGVGMMVGNLRHGTLEEANAVSMDLLALRPSELPVRLERLVPEDQRAVHRSMRAQLEINGRAGPVATEYVRADGRRVPVLLSAALVEPLQGEFVAVLVDRAAESDAAGRAA